MDRLDYEWHYYIGGRCALKRRKYGGVIATIEHIDQGVYEAFILRDHSPYKRWSLGIFTNSDQAQSIIEQVLKEKFNESTSAVRRMD